MEGKGHVGLTNCEVKAKYNKKWLAKDCSCAEHVLAREWYAVTGDSFVVDVRDVWGADGAIGYLSKYLRKGFEDREILESFGFVRRYDRSRNWCGKVRRVGSVFGVWDSQTFEWGHAPDDEPAILKAAQSKWWERVGPEHMIKVMDERRRTSVLNQYEKVGVGGSERGG